MLSALISYFNVQFAPLTAKKITFIILKHSVSAVTELLLEYILYYIFL